ncbi:hypothetical protein TERMP_00495 [Thermococcus barophilus MP]|uniref:Transposase n=1 Tax=Thermococcus barophilus (strain DSM 11836 / MP) TaxID=391623 RepID=F0LJK6_THEBM|nr:hypothetical protein TERMP_00495 [Thermococcus barophilus MP]
MPIAMKKKNPHAKYIHSMLKEEALDLTVYLWSDENSMRRSKNITK